MALCLVGSAVTRIVLACLKESGEEPEVWSQIVLPVAATLLYVLIVLLSGDELFYKTAIPVWMMAIYSGIWISNNAESRMMVWLFWIALIFFAYLYTDITSGRKATAVWLLPVAAAPVVFILYFYRNALTTGNWGACLVLCRICFFCLV